MPPTDLDRIAELEALAKAATPGPRDLWAENRRGDGTRIDAPGARMPKRAGLFREGPKQWEPNEYELCVTDPVGFTIEDAAQIAAFDRETCLWLCSLARTNAGLLRRCLGAARHCFAYEYHGQPDDGRRWKELESDLTAALADPAVSATDQTAPDAHGYRPGPRPMGWDPQAHE